MRRSKACDDYFEQTSVLMMLFLVVHLAASIRNLLDWQRRSLSLLHRVHILVDDLCDIRCASRQSLRSVCKRQRHSRGKQKPTNCRLIFFSLYMDLFSDQIKTILSGFIIRGYLGKWTLLIKSIGMVSTRVLFSG